MVVKPSNLNKISLMPELGAEVVIVGGVRTPFCRSYTGYMALSNLDLLTTVLKGIVAKFNLKSVHIDEVIAGAVINHSKDWNIAREAVIDSGLAQSTPGITLQQACGTSLQAALIIAAKIKAGEINCGVAAGSDTISDAPIVFKKKFAQRMVNLSRARSFNEKLKVFKGFGLNELAPQPPSTAEPHTGLSMGQHCELMARRWDISRERQDEIVLNSHQKATQAYQAGFFDNVLEPTAGIMRDNNLREDITMEQLQGLKLAFDRKSGYGSLTAGNSTPLTDGAGAVLLASRAWAEAQGLPILASFITGETAANDFIGGDGLLMAPVIAMARMLKRQKLGLQDFDVFEIHEAFAAQYLATIEALRDIEYCQEICGLDQALGEIDPALVNIKGGSLAFGHPFAATGARVLLNAAHILDENHKNQKETQQKPQRALLSVCTAGGMGVTAIIAR